MILLRVWSNNINMLGKYITQYRHLYAYGARCIQTLSSSSITLTSVNFPVTHHIKYVQKQRSREGFGAGNNR